MDIIINDDLKTHGIGQICICYQHSKCTTHKLQLYCSTTLCD